MCSFIWIPGAASASSYCQSSLFECQHYYYSRWCNSRCLSACLSATPCLSLCVFVCLSHPLLLYFPQFCLIAIIMCLPNGIHLKPAFSTLCKHLYFSRLDILPLFHTYTVMGETENVLCCCLASLSQLFTAEALTVELLTSLGRMDTLTFHTLKCGSARYY